MMSCFIASVACLIVSAAAIVGAVYLLKKDSDVVRGNDKGWVLLNLLKCQVLTYANDIHKATPENEDQAKSFAAQEATCYEIADEITRAIEEAYSTKERLQQNEIRTVKQLIEELARFDLNSDVLVMANGESKIDCVITNSEAKTLITLRNRLAE